MPPDKMQQTVMTPSYQLHLPPKAADLLYARARRLHDEGEHAAAAGVCRHVLAQAPSHCPAVQLLGALAFEQRRPALAATFFRRALRLAPENAALLTNLAVARRAAGHIPGCLQLHRCAAAAAPETAAIYYNHANALQHVHRFNEAIRDYQRTLRIEPDHVEAHWNLAIAYLRTGRYAEGWPEYEWRWHRRGAPPAGHGTQWWTGEPFAGRSLRVFVEQGLGDALQFSRYLPMVAERGGAVVFHCQPEVACLMAGLHPRITVTAFGEDLPAFDLEVSLMSLPGIFGTDAGNIPSRVPYLRPAMGPAEVPEGPELKVGLVWGSSPTNPLRNCPLSALLPLGAIHGVRLFSLQKGAHANDLTATPGASELIVDLAGQFTNLSATGRILDKLDLVITVDTSVAHLAGALARPTWILLPHLADWRWLLEREDSPWYPTARLFRQPAPGDWAAVAARLHEALHLLATSTAHTDGRRVS